MSDYDDDFDNFVESKDDQLPDTKRNNEEGKHTFGNGANSRNKAASRLSKESIKKSQGDISLPEVRGSTKELGKVDSDDEEKVPKPSGKTLPASHQTSSKVKSKTKVKDSVANKFNPILKKPAKNEDEDDYKDDDSFHDDSDEQDKQGNPQPSKKKKDLRFLVDKFAPKNTITKGSRQSSPKLKPKLSLGKYKFNSDVERGSKSKRPRLNMNRSMMSTTDMKNISSLKTEQKPRIKLNPMAEIQKDIEKSKKQLSKILKLREIGSTQTDEEDKLLYLTKENIILRTEFKELNKNLNKFIELMKDLKYKRANRYRGANQSMRDTRESKIEFKLGEQKSYEQMIENMITEQKKLRDRLEVVGDPNYSLSLRKKIIDTKDHIQTLEESERKQLNDKFLKNKDAERVINNGQSDAMRATQDGAKELTYLTDHLQKIEKKITKQENMKEDAYQRYQLAKHKLENLEQNAAKDLNLDEVYGLTSTEPEIDVHNDPKNYERKKLVIQQAMKTTQAKYQTKLAELKEKYEELLNSRNDCIEGIRLRQDQTIEAREKAKDLMIKSKIMSEDSLVQDTKHDETLNDLPDLCIVEENPMIMKLNQALKGSKKRHKLNKSVASAIGVRQSANKPSRGGAVTKRANKFSLRKKANMPDFDKNPISSSQNQFDISKTKRNDDEMSLDNSSEKKPLYRNRMNAKAF
ncbi:unnamed protein product [Moneuplotes crassus]|uniref:Uncharacterized protein n=1 Tax=Euplotes crassus TaxID=5936 RepID=A0AAD1X6B3_EUPCR|nr:unnamed protein product [Moneuplotes crassus]